LIRGDTSRESRSKNVRRAGALALYNVASSIADHSPEHRMLGNHLSSRELAALCRRLATALEAGLDVRRVVAREASGRGRRALIERFEELRLDVNRGHSLTDALAKTGDFFPTLFRQMVRLGEETGRLPETLKHLAEHYELQVKLRRAFLAAISWPLFQLTFAICIVGLLIWVLGMIGNRNGAEPIDLLGLGLVGSRGAAIYFSLVGAIALVAFLAIRAILRGQLWARPLARLALKLPVIGGSLTTLALARLSWSLYLTLDAGLDLRKAIPLALDASRHPGYRDAAALVVQEIGRGREITEAMTQSGVFPREFLDAVEVGERSGKLPEQMGLLSRQYDEQARRALATLTGVAGFGVWLLVAALVIVMIFRIFNTLYLAPLEDALKGL
jgi:type IV pilus assembly protein PilC